MVKSQIQGSEGKITTYAFYPLGYRIFFCFSETKWHLEDKYKRMPIWFAFVDGFPSLFIWKLAIFYDGREKEQIEQSVTKGDS